MEREPRAYLFDIRENCDRISKFVGGIGFPEYQGSELIKAAVERSFINIGEALVRLKQLDASIFGKIPDAGRIIAFRNILVHGYESISDELVWEIVQLHVPVLGETCRALLEEMK